MRRPTLASVLVCGSAALLAVTLLPTTSTAAPKPKPTRQDAPVTAEPTGDHHPDDIDLRTDDGAQAVLRRRDLRLRAHPRPGLRALRDRLGTQGVVSLDPLTGTPSAVAKLDGFLTAPSDAAASKVALGYVRGRLSTLGLTERDLETLRLRETYVDIGGTRHLSWTQYAGGVPVFGNGLKANVTRGGRLVSVQGSPVHGLASTGLRNTGSTELGPSAARRSAVRDVDGSALQVRAGAARGTTRSTRFANGDSASLVSFQTVRGPRVAWQTLTRPRGGQLFLHVVDAASGRVLYRRDLVQYDSGKVWKYWPGKAIGGKRKVVNLTKRGWLPKGSPQLAGNNTHVWSDIDDDNESPASEEITPGRSSFQFPFTDFTATDGAPCGSRFQCSWDSSTANSWKKNRKQNAVQVFYYVNKMHDHLRANPIGFTRAAGNFESVDDDAVQAQPDDGANTGDGFPDSRHIDNANMSTPPDGTPPTMQMYLFNDPADPTDPFLQSNGGDEADVVYHEYTHGLSNRLVVDPNGVSTLGNVQAGSMGEAWSDWYAMDYLVNAGYQADRAGQADVSIGEYVARAIDGIRSQPLDCKVGSQDDACRGTPAAGRGGYTYGDFGKVFDGPEVHADGEIWGETLWDLRTALGSKLAEKLVTRAMELSPANPSFLDMRNSILQADTVNGGGGRARIWRVFAHRGMGYFAGAVDGDDMKPVEDFSLAPAAGTPTGSLTGTVTNSTTSEKVPDATVAFGGHASGFPTDYAGTTDGDGSYTITGILAGTYPKVWAGGTGYDRVVRTLSIASGVNRRNWALRRDWAALSGGAAEIATSDDSGAPYGCGAEAMFDQSQAQGWSAERVVENGTVTPATVVVRLPRTIDVSQVAIDPSGTCGDDPTASAGPYSLETSTNGTTWRPASSGTFTAANIGRFTSPTLAPAATSDVRYLRYTIKDSQGHTDCPGDSGCDWLDSSEIEVYGTSSAP